jgi:soluble P-type ATPase
MSRGQPPEIRSFEVTMIEIEIPGFAVYQFHHLVLDVNGTIAKDGRIIQGVPELLQQLRPDLTLHLITADTHGMQEDIDKRLGIASVRIPTQNQIKAKRDFVETLGAETVVAMGNGANDSAMLERAALGVFVIGAEGSAIEAMLRSKVVAPDIKAALELLINPKRLAATLRR